MKFVSIVSVALLVALASCKAPTSPPSNGQTATLTLVLPDSARALDTATFHARYSDPLQPSWKFEWLFGDSTRVTTSDTNISHVYDSAGTYTMEVTLADSAGKSLAKQSHELQVLPQNPPTLTLTVPDTVYWGDSCVMSVSSSQPLKPGWTFRWFLGDTTIVFGTNAVLHYYLTPGNYTVLTDLIDTIRNVQISSKTVTVHLVARHFDLGLLRSMKYVDVTWSANSNTEISGTASICGEPNPTISTQMITSSDSSFGSFDQDGTGYWDSTHNNLIDSSSYINSSSGSWDINHTRLINFSESSSSFEFYQGPPSFCRLTAGYDFSTENVPFKIASDSDIVFEENGPLCKGSAFSSYVKSNSLWGSGSYSSQVTANFSKVSANPFIIIRFYK